MPRNPTRAIFSRMFEPDTSPALYPSTQGATSVPHRCRRARGTVTRTKSGIVSRVVIVPSKSKRARIMQGTNEHLSVEGIRSTYPAFRHPGNISGCASREHENSRNQCLDHWIDQRLAPWMHMRRPHEHRVHERFAFQGEITHAFASRLAIVDNTQPRHSTPTRNDIAFARRALRCTRPYPHKVKWEPRIRGLT